MEKQFKFKGATIDVYKQCGKFKLLMQWKQQMIYDEAYNYYHLVCAIGRLKTILKMAVKRYEQVHSKI